ncbi:iron uptake system protein EfeO [Mesorhizobium sp.]|uniref:iron uptake system protein EfeO n=1 Tax=Mesorhizobium sp. TaxID=1871066 RepID=UPI003BA9729E
MKQSQIAAVVAFLVIAAGGGYYAWQQGGDTGASKPVAGAAAPPVQPSSAAPGKVAEATVTVSARACDPENMTVPAGKVTFSIVNKSTRALEWEILSGVMVVDERENIAPGFTQKLTTTLEPGDYEITCGLLTNPKGKLHVTGAMPASVKPKLVDLIGPMAEYKVYLGGEAAGLGEATVKFANAIKAGDLDTARKLYAPARAHYESIKPIAELFADLDAAIDANAGAYEKKEADPGFGGFHRIEYGLFAQSNTTSLAPLADKLSIDVAQLGERLRTLTVPPDKMAAGAASLIEQVASSKIAGEGGRYSLTDLWDIQANVDGARKIVDLLRPVLAKADNALTTRLDIDFSTVAAILARYRAADGSFATYDKMTEDDRAALQQAMVTLANDLAALSGALGLS